MKTLLFILIFNLSAISFAQDPQLFENMWYLHNLIIEGESHIPPTNDELESVQLSFYEPNSLETAACYVLNASVHFIDPDRFSLFDGGMSMQGCEDAENNDFADFYIINFFDDHFDEIFVYSLSVEGSTKTLTIINASGNVAIYGNEMLYIKNIKDSQFAVYPNPANEQITITSKNMNGILEINIFDLVGQLIKVENLTIEKSFTLDVSDLSSGIYFLNIKSEDGFIEVKKFIKR